MTRLAEAEPRGSLGCLSAAGREPGWEQLLAPTAPREGWGSGFGSWSKTQAPEIELKESGPPVLRDCCGNRVQLGQQQGAIHRQTLLEARPALRAEALPWENVGVFCARVRPWSPVSHLQPRPRDQGTAFLWLGKLLAPPGMP